MAIVLVGIVNAVNLTDGIDGLDGSITFFACLFMMLIANVLGDHGANVLYAAAGAGGCLGFLVWNFHPAKCFMGDTGSLFLGGLVCSMAFAMDMQLLLLLIALTYLLEMFSVMLQVSYFKLTHGKRIFKMSPIHHHFEMCGWSEMKIVCVFSAFTAICGLIALLLVIFLPFLGILYGALQMLFKIGSFRKFGDKFADAGMTGNRKLEVDMGGAVSGIERKFLAFGPNAIWVIWSHLDDQRRKIAAVTCVPFKKT